MEFEVCQLYIAEIVNAHLCLGLLLYDLMACHCL